jgi:hypothetical protein
MQDCDYREQFISLDDPALGKRIYHSNTSSVLNAEIHFCPLQCLFLIFKVKKLFFRL